MQASKKGTEHAGLRAWNYERRPYPPAARNARNATFPLPACASRANSFVHATMVACPHAYNIPHPLASAPSFPAPSPHLPPALDVSGRLAPLGRQPPRQQPPPVALDNHRRRLLHTGPLAAPVSVNHSGWWAGDCRLATAG